LTRPALTIADHRLLLWRLVDARYPDEIAQLETLAGTTQRAAVEYAIERSGFRDFFPGFTGRRGTPAARLAAARRFSRLAMLYLISCPHLMKHDAPPRTQPRDEGVLSGAVAVRSDLLRRLRGSSAGGDRASRIRAHLKTGRCWNSSRPPGGRNLLPAEAAAGVRHHVALSIVGIDRSDNGYFRAKVAQEKLIVASGIPYTIIRATQFLEFLGGIAASSADGNIVRLSPGLFQPIAADDVAPIVAEVALAAPRNGIVEIAGPERAPFNEIVARYLKAVGDPREVVSDPEARYFGGRVEERSLVPLGEARLGRIGFDEWLRRSQAGA
jgi:hypothetical protein